MGFICSFNFYLNFSYHLNRFNELGISIKRHNFNDELELSTVISNIFMHGHFWHNAAISVISYSESIRVYSFILLISLSANSGHCKKSKQ